MPVQPLPNWSRLGKAKVPALVMPLLKEKFARAGLRNSLKDLKGRAARVKCF